MLPSSRDRAWPAAAVLGTLAAIGPIFLLVTANADDALTGAQAMLVAEGAVPYRDYFSPLWPGADLLYGGWFAMVGASYAALRALTTLGLLAGVTAAFGLGRRVLTDAWAGALALLWGAWSAQFLGHGPYHLLGSAAVMGMAWGLLRARRSLRPSGWFAAAGALAGLATTFRQSLGIVALAGLAAALMLEPRWRRSVLPMAAGGAAVGVSMLAWLAAAGALNPFVEQTFGFTTLSYLPANFRGIPRVPVELTGLWGAHRWTRGLLEAGIWAGGLLVPLGALLALLREPLRRSRARLLREPLALAVVAVAILAAAVYRPDAPVLWSSAFPALVLGAALTRRWPAVRRATPWVAGALVALALLPAAADWLRLAGVGPAPRPVAARGAVGPALVPAGQAEAIERALEPRAGPTAFLPSLKALYVLSGRPPPISFVILRHGYSSPEQVRRAQEELVREGVHWVVYAPGLDRFRGTDDPWTLPEFLDERYERVATLGQLPSGPLELYRSRS